MLQRGLDVLQKAAQGRRMMKIVVVLTVDLKLKLEYGVGIWAVCL